MLYQHDGRRRHVRDTYVECGVFLGFLFFAVPAAFQRHGDELTKLIATVAVLWLTRYAARQICREFDSDIAVVAGIAGTLAAGIFVGVAVWL